MLLLPYPMFLVVYLSFFSSHIGISAAPSNAKCNIFARKCCRGKIYQQSSIEQRKMVPVLKRR